MSCSKVAGKWWVSAPSIRAMTALQSTIMPRSAGPDALTGCLREKAVTYIVAEVIILEFTGLDIRRRADEKTGVSLPVHGRPDGAPDSSPRRLQRTGHHPLNLYLKRKGEKEEEDVPGGLAGIIRDLTRRPRA